MHWPDRPTSPPNASVPDRGAREVVFVVAVRPETGAAPWQARLLYAGAGDAGPSEFASPLALVRHLARLSSNPTDAPPGRGGLR